MRFAPDAANPSSYQAQLATLVKTAPEGDGWLHEIKYDGYRIGAVIDGRSVSLMSRRGNDWTANFRELADALRRLKVQSAMLDGEAAILLPDGRTSFHALQNAFSGGARPGLTYFVFDLLLLDGEPVWRQPLEERKARLLQLLTRIDTPLIRYSDHFIGDGRKAHAQACALKLEGLISKRRNLAYQPGRNANWVKTKCIHRQEFVIGGFTEPEGSRAGIGSLLVGFYEGQRLVWGGKVGTGFTQAFSVQLRKRLDAMALEACPFTPRPEGWLGRNAHWVRPELVCEVEFTEWTPDGKIRHPSFQGLREDKKPTEVRREVPADEASEPPPGKKPARAEAAKRPAQKGREEIAGVSLSHPGRVMFPAIGLTKAGLARFYEQIGEWIVPHLVDRPLTLLRCGDGIEGECAFMKHSKLWAPEQLRRVRIQEKTKLGEYLIADSVEAVVALVQMDVVEIHTWNSRFARVEQPDRIVFDLDPGPEVKFGQVIQAAKMVRAALQALGLESFVKTTGGVGLHVVVPIAPKRDWSECLDFSRSLAEAIVRQHPKGYTTAFAKRGRETQILIDYLRNNRTNTSVAAFSVRAKPKAPVSVPLSWDELTARSRSDAFHVGNVPARLKRLRKDPWARSFGMKQVLTRAMLDAVKQL